MGLTFSLSRPFARLSPQPIDSSSVFTTLCALTTYAFYDPTAYSGQMCAVTALSAAFIVTDTKGVVQIQGGGGGEGDVTKAYVHTNFLTLTGGTITGSISSNDSIIVNTLTSNTLTVPVSVTSLTATKTFLNTDTNRIFHFNTTTEPLCAIFPPSLPNGFNIALMNTGINNLRLSAAQLNSVGVTIGVRYGGAFVYKDNNELFAVGRL